MQDTQQRERRMSALYGVGLILLGGFVLVLYFSRGDDAWAPIVLAMASLTLGAFYLIRAFHM